MAPGNRPFAGQTIIIELIDKTSTELQDFAHKRLKDPLPLEINVAVGKPAEEIIRVAEEITRHAPCPVFTIRHQGEANA